MNYAGPCIRGASKSLMHYCQFCQMMDDFTNADPRMRLLHKCETCAELLFGWIDNIYLKVFSEGHPTRKIRLSRRENRKIVRANVKPVNSRATVSLSALSLGEVPMHLRHKLYPCVLFSAEGGRNPKRKGYEGYEHSWRTLERSPIRFHGWLFR